MVIGPYAPGSWRTPSLAEQLADVGVILLMFGVGLQFSRRGPARQRRVSVPRRPRGQRQAFALGAGPPRPPDTRRRRRSCSGSRLRWPARSCWFRVLAGQPRTAHLRRHIAVGWLVVEDLFTVIVLVLLPTLFEGIPAPVEDGAQCRPDVAEGLARSWSSPLSSDGGLSAVLPRSGRRDAVGASCSR